MGTLLYPLVRISTPLGTSLLLFQDLDVLGAAADMNVVDSAMRYPHADWGREQQADPTCQVAIRCIISGRPPDLLPDFLSLLPLHQRPSFSEIQEFAGKGELYTTEARVVMLVRKPTPRAEPLNIYT